ASDCPSAGAAECACGQTTGPGPRHVSEAVDRLFDATSVDHVLVEADGARTMSIKAPGDHEPLIPGRSTIVIVVVGADALGRPLIDVAHRPERIAELTDTTVDSIVTAELAAAVLLHPGGGRKSVPANARLVMAISRVPANDEAVTRLATMLTSHPSVDRVVTVPLVGRPPFARPPGC
ncbi:MAG: selenium cofactor biosynthesis protein YqeC, partial [Actinomycetota bacterium]